MEYEITQLPRLSPKPDVEGIYDNPKSAKSVLAYLRMEFRGKQFDILRDGVKITDAELDADIESFDIQAVREESARLPGNYRRGWGTERDDLAIGPDGRPAKVWAPPNPEDSD
jgi:hypothetical protein